MAGLALDRSLPTLREAVCLYCEIIDLPEHVPLATALVSLCSRFGQLRVCVAEDGCRGFLVWLRYRLEHERLFKGHHWLGVASLSTEELTGGECLYFAEALAGSPGWLFKTTREVMRDPTIHKVACWHDGKWHEKMNPRRQ